MNAVPAAEALILCRCLLASHVNRIRMHARHALLRVRTLCASSNSFVSAVSGAEAMMRGLVQSSISTESASSTMA